MTGSRECRLLPIVLITAAFFCAGSLSAQQEAAVGLKKPAGVAVHQQGTSVKKLYEELAKKHGFSVVFDPKLRDVSLNYRFQGLDREQALDRLTFSAGHFYVEVDDNVIVVAEDTPQNRREYEELAVRLFVVENLPLKEVDKMLRSLIECRRLAVIEEINAILVRETVEKMKIAEQLVELVDKPQAELDVFVEIFETDASSPLSSESRPAFRSKADLDRLRSGKGAKMVASASISILGEDPAKVRTAQTDGRTLCLDVGGRIHPRTQHVSLRSKIQLGACVEGQAGKHRGHLEFESSARVASGETAAFTGFVAHEDGNTIPTKEIVVLLTPTIVNEPGFDEEDLRQLLVGTESRIEFGGFGK